MKATTRIPGLLAIVCGTQSVICISRSQQPPMLPAGQQPRTYYLAATATDENGLVSDFSNEVSLRLTNGSILLTLAWDAPESTNVIRSYTIWRGKASHTYTTNYNAGTNLTLTLRLPPPPLSNIVLYVTSVNATNLQYAETLDGPWHLTMSTNETWTNPQNPSVFWAAMGNSLETPAKCFIRSWRY